VNRTATVVCRNTFFCFVFSFLHLAAILLVCFLFFDVAFSVVILQRINAHILEPRTIAAVLVPGLSLGVLETIDLLDGINETSIFKLVDRSNRMNLIMSTSRSLFASLVYLFLRRLHADQPQTPFALYLSNYLPRHRASSTVILCGNLAG
jgi:hypothetical protein